MHYFTYTMIYFIFFTFVFLKNERLFQDIASFFDNSSIPQECKWRESNFDPTHPQDPTVMETHIYKSKYVKLLYKSQIIETEMKYNYQSLTYRK